MGNFASVTLGHLSAGKLFLTIETTSCVRSMIADILDAWLEIPYYSVCEVLSGSGYISVAGSCEHSNEQSNSIQGEGYFEQLSNA